MHSATMNLYFTEGELLMSESKRLKQCPICKESSEMYCSCGYEFGGNRCTNPNCKQACDDLHASVRIVTVRHKTILMVIYKGFLLMLNN